MRALSLWQPWASLIAEGIKRIETRHWATAYRGLLVIHAAQRTPVAADWQGTDLERVLRQYRVMPSLCVRGGCVALAQLRNCIATDRLRPTWKEQACGNFAPGRYAWILDEIVSLPFLPCRGRQGLFTLDTQIEEQIQEFLARPRHGRHMGACRDTGATPGGHGVSAARRTTIRVGQRLRNWDGTSGYVTLNSQGKRVFGPGEPFLVEWLGLDGSVEDSTYYTLEDLEKEGITFGRGVMPWAL